MLQAIRDKSQGWIAWVIIVAICIPFALWGVRYFYGSNSNPVVAKVSGEEITQQMLGSMYNRMRRQLRAQDGSQHYTQAQIDQLKKQALDTLVHSIALTQAAQNDGFRTDTGMAEAALARMPIFQVNGVFSQERFSQILNAMLYTPDQFFIQLSNLILVNQVKSGIVQTAFVMPSEIKRVYALMNQKRQFDYLIIPAKSFVKNVSVSNEAALKYYQTHADEFKVPEQVSLSYLQLSLKDIAKTIKPAQSELINFYQNNLGTFTTPRQVKIKQLLIAVAPNASSDDWNKALDKMNALAAQLKKGADFDALVKTNSQSPQKEAFWISTARLSPAVNQNLKLMKSSGDISMPVKTQLGYVIIKLLDSKPQKVSAFKEVEAKVSKNYQDQAAQKRFSTLSDQLANETFENPTSLDKAAKNLNLSIKTTDFFSQQGTKDGLASHDNVVHAAFSEDVLQGNNSDLINLDDNDVIVVRLKTHKPASEKPFDQVKDDIINKLKVQEAANNAQTFGQALLTSLQKGESINSQLTSQGLSFKTTDFVARHETKKIDSVVVNMAFDIPRSSLQKPDQSIAGQALSSGDYAIVKLKAVQDGQLDKPSVLDQFGAGYTAALGAQAYNFYVDSLLKRAKISYLNNQ